MKYFIELNDTQLELLSVMKFFISIDSTNTHILGARPDSVAEFRAKLGISHEADPMKIIYKEETYPSLVNILNWSLSKTKKVIRDLFGIIAMYEYPILIPETGCNAVKYIEFFIADQNYSLIDETLKTGKFEKKLEERDIPILKLIYERDKELKAKYGNRWNPRFHNTFISEKANVGKYSSRASLDRLTGVLALAYTIHSKTVRNHDEIWVVNNNRPKWFLTNQRIPDAEKILKQYI